MLLKIQSVGKSLYRHFPKYLTFLLLTQLIGWAQEKTSDEKIYQSLPAKVVLSEQDITETINCFRTDDPKKEVEKFKEKMPPLVTDSKFRQNVFQKLPESFKQLKLEDKQINDLIRRLISPVLSFYQREEAYEVWVIKHPTPVVFSDSGVLLVISTGLIERLANDDEILGYIAHEVGHEYYSKTSIYTKYVLGLVMENHKDQALARKYWESLAIIELKCDGFGALTLTKLGYNPLASIEGLERIENDFPKLMVGFHPHSTIRRKVIESILPVEFLSHKTIFSADLKKLKELISSISPE